jgi:hypothetical protein
LIRLAILSLLILTSVTAEATNIALPDQPAYKVRDYIKYIFSRVPSDQLETDSTGNQFTISGELKLDVRKIREPKRSDVVRSLEIAKKISFELDGMQLDFTQAQIEIINVPAADLNSWTQTWGTLPEVTDFKKYTGNKIKLPIPGYLIYDDENETAALFIWEALRQTMNYNSIAAVDFERAVGRSDRLHLTLSQLDLNEQSKFVATIKSGQRLYANLLAVPFPKDDTPLRQALHKLAGGEITLNKFIVIKQSELKKALDCISDLE